MIEKRNVGIRLWAMAVIAALVLGAGGCKTDTDDSPPKVPKTWKTATVPADASGVNFNKVAFANGVFVASGKDYMARSSDGITWTKATDITALGSNNMRIFSGNNYFIATGGSGSDKGWAKSSDGNTWTTIGDTTNFPSSAGCYGDGKNFISGQSGRIAYNITADASGTWTIKDNTATGFAASGPSSWINAIAYGNNTCVAGGGAGRIIWSTDLNSWKPATSTQGDGNIETLFDGTTSFVGSITFGGGSFIAIGGQDNAPYPTKVAWSADGKTWTESNLDLTTTQNSGGRYCGSVYHDGVFVMTTQDGKVSCSTDGGKNWTASGEIGFNINGICYGNGKFVAAGPGGKIAYSTAE